MQEWSFKSCECCGTEFGSKYFGEPTRARRISLVTGTAIMSRWNILLRNPGDGDERGSLARRKLLCRFARYSPDNYTTSVNY